MQLYEILVQSARAALPLQDAATGAMPAGHNGPYLDADTPVRNTAHWLITFLKCFEVGGDRRFLEAAGRAADYLASAAARPMGATFWHRKNPRKDTCNGLVGQAWTFEALAEAAAALDRPDLLRLGREVFLLHPFDAATGLWRCVGADGTHLSLDPTFNHQLWFAACGGLLTAKARAVDTGNDFADNAGDVGADEVDARVRQFTNRLPRNFGTDHSGLIRHLLPDAPRTARSRARAARDALKARLGRPRPSTDRAVGYHAFNLYGFALLKRSQPDHPFWASPGFAAALSLQAAPWYRRELPGNKYGYPYNPPGAEHAFAIETFAGGTRADQEWWLAEQFRRCYDFGSHSHDRGGSKDPVTHAARLYEATRLPNLDVNVDAGNADDARGSGDRVEPDVGARSKDVSAAAGGGGLL